MLCVCREGGSLDFCDILRGVVLHLCILCLPKMGPWLWKETESKVMAENHEIRLMTPFVCRHCPAATSQQLEVESTGQADGMTCYGSHSTDGIMVHALLMGGICMM